MEKFKACEKEMKTKAFSKGGLLQSAKLDPKAQEKMQTTAWLQDCVENLLLQVEASEAEIETLQAGGRKKNKAGSERAEELDQLNTRRKWHISRLEIMLRLLDNGTINSEQALELKEDINYYVEDNAVSGPLVPKAFCVLGGVLSQMGRRTTITRMRACMMNSTSTRRKRSSVSWQTNEIQTSRKMRAKVRCFSLSASAI